MRTAAAALAFATAFACGSCTSASPGSPSTLPSVAVPSDRAGTCRSDQVRRAIASFFRAWNARNRVAVADAFTENGELDFSTKRQSALSQGVTGFTDVATRPMIGSFATRQWRLGERLGYRGMTIFAGSTSADSGAEVKHVIAHFADGSTQRFTEAKFHYDCGSESIPHAVFASASKAK